MLAWEEGLEAEQQVEDLHRVYQKSLTLILVTSFLFLFPKSEKGRKKGQIYLCTAHTPKLIQTIKRRKEETS